MRKHLLCALVAASISTVSASIITTEEAPGVLNSTMAGATNVVTFNAISTGNWAGGVTSIGTYTSGAAINAADQYGGTNTRYINVGGASSPNNNSSALTYTLTFNTAQTYFGLLWNALDSGNSLSLYNGATLLATYNSASFAGVSGYNGNPCGIGCSFNGNDSGEKFFFVNFSSNAVGTNFTKVVFTNAGTGTGFETDNHTILAAPEPATFTLVGLSFLGLGGLGLRRKLRKQS